MSDTASKIAEITIDRVMSVYSGVDGKCCCGCAGNHRYASKHAARASKHRGYKVTPDEVSDKSVKIIFNKLQKNRNDESAMFHDKGVTNFASVVVGTRLYVVYFLGN